MLNSSSMFSIIADMLLLMAVSIANNKELSGVPGLLEYIEQFDNDENRECVRK